MEVSVSYVQSHFSKVATIVVVTLLIWCFWPRGSKQVCNPDVYGVALPNSKVNIDQRSVQYQVQEKPFEVGCGVLGGEVSDKPAYGAVIFFRYKF